MDDEAEKIYSESQDLALFHHYETENRNRPLKASPLMPLLKKISFFFKKWIKKKLKKTQIIVGC